MKLILYKLLDTGPAETATPQQTSVTSAARATNTGSSDTSKGTIRILLVFPS